MGLIMELFLKPLQTRVTDYERDTAGLRVYTSKGDTCGPFVSLVCQMDDCHECRGCDHACHQICAEAIDLLRHG